jgi:hypothetical protein
MNPTQKREPLFAIYEAFERQHRLIINRAMARSG